MKNIAVIGATGLLGKSMMTYKNTVACPIRFEQSQDFKKWFDDHPEVNTVWYVARACRKTGLRRDFSTFMLEKKAIINLLKSRANKCKIVFASTKVVYGLTDDNISETTCEYVVSQFQSDTTGIINCPTNMPNTKISIAGLGKEHKIYALTKLMCESYIKRYCKKFKIVRIWDMIK